MCTFSLNRSFLTKFSISSSSWSGLEADEQQIQVEMSYYLRFFRLGESSIVFGWHWLATMEFSAPTGFPPVRERHLKSWTTALDDLRPREDYDLIWCDLIFWKIEKRKKNIFIENSFWTVTRKEKRSGYCNRKRTTYLSGSAKATHDQNKKKIT
jgi:hypothetical protein